MGLTGKQKKQLRKKIKKQSLDEVIQQLGVSRDEAVKYLKRFGYKEEKSVKGFSFRQWVRENKHRLLFLAGLALLTYINAWGAEFVSDDVYGIVNNQHLGDFKRAISNPLTLIRPLYYWLMFSMFGKLPAAFRSINIFTHILMVLAIFLLVELIVKERTTALLAGILTAVHPILIEAVTWISGGGHSQYALMLVLSFILYILAGQKRKYYWWSVVFFLLGLQFSEKAGSYPAILLAYQWLFDRKRKWWELAPFFGLTGLWGALYLGKVSVRLNTLHEEFATNVENMNPWLQVPVAITSYLGLIFWPDKLTLYHSDLRVTPWQFGVKTVITGLIVLVGLVSFWWGMKGKEWAKQVCFWLAVFVISLIPTLIPLGVAWVVAERYVYLGAIGILVLIAYGISKLSKRKGWYEVIMMGFGIIAVMLMIRTLVRNHDWKTADNLWLAAARTSPNSPQNNNNLGDYYARHGDLQKAIYHFKRAAELRPGYADPIHNLANIYFQTGEIEEAFKAYSYALRLKPSLWQSHQALAGIYFKQGNLDKTIEELGKALQIVPDNQDLQDLLLKIKAKQAEEKK